MITIILDKWFVLDEVLPLILDKWFVLDEVLLLLPQIPTREPAVLMSILGKIT